MADLSIEGLGRVAVRAAYDDGLGYDDVPAEEQQAACRAVQAVLAALAEAAGDPQALGRLAHEAWSNALLAEGVPAGTVRIPVAWPDANAALRERRIAEAQAVAAVAVAGVREREVAPLVPTLAAHQRFWRAYRAVEYGGEVDTSANPEAYNRLVAWNREYDASRHALHDLEDEAISVQAVVCDRCHQAVQGLSSWEATAGFYRVDAGPWQKYGNPGETFVCDACMASDERYKADYPAALGVTRDG